METLNFIKIYDQVIDDGDSVALCFSLLNKFPESQLLANTMNSFDQRLASTRKLEFEAREFGFRISKHNEGDELQVVDTNQGEVLDSLLRQNPESFKSNPSLFDRLRTVISSFGGIIEGSEVETQTADIVKVFNYGLLETNLIELQSLLGGEYYQIADGILDNMTSEGKRRLFSFIFPNYFPDSEDAPNLGELEVYFRLMMFDATMVASAYQKGKREGAESEE